MSRYQSARSGGYSHEQAVVLDSRSVVEEELEHPRSELSPAELHTVVANARQDISAITILLSHISAAQKRTENRYRRIEWWLFLVIVVLGVIAAT